MADQGPRMLLIETSARSGQVALAQGESVLALGPLDESRRNGRDLAPAALALLAGQAWRPGDIDAVAVSVGPGSYTGLRVGVMSAKAFAYAAGCALLGVETFLAVAAQAPPGLTRLDVLADAQQERVYVQPFGRAAGADWEALAALAVMPLAEWLARRDPAAWLSGPGVDVHAGRLPAGLPVVEADRRRPSVAGLLRVALPRFLAGRRDDVFAVEPLYLRPSSAEEKWLASGR
jgi:tRNA threonylcarbamoyladenosine biosynthesis protein TsaB